ncbi:sensor histidine kinase KdpD [Nocardiopsis sp. FIRDI 009]|uniref:sensor histidine kinase n=1 Tax=Nocardiopsis sp. FIRDI 009 TaxID=714197 RepID=UPI001E3F6838|nr:ATP-binding protein [Nocardiopsis sp. FIRDI 009]
MHQPVHPHSRSDEPPKAPKDGGGDRRSAGPTRSEDDPSDRPVGPFSASAEKGYRPATRTSVPNPYTTRRLEIDDVDTGARSVGQWRGMGLDEPDPRGRPRTTDSPAHMSDTTPNTGAAARPTTGPQPRTAEGSAEQDQREPAAPAPPADDAAHSTDTPRHTSEPAAHRAPSRQGADGTRATHTPRTGENGPVRSASPEPSGEGDRRTSATGKHGADPLEGGSRMDDQPNPYGTAEPRTTDPTTGQYAERSETADPGPHARARESAVPPAGAPGPGPVPPGQAPDPTTGTWPQAVHPLHPLHAPQGHPPQAAPAQPGFHGPVGGQGYPTYAGYPGQPPYPGQAAHHAHPPHQGPGYQPAPVQHHPAPYAPPHPMVAYQNPYPVPYQPPGYVFPGQPVVLPGQFPVYGQPVHHVIVLTSGQAPQVITAEPAADRAEPEREGRTEAGRGETGRDGDEDTPHARGVAEEAAAEPAADDASAGAEEEAPTAERDDDGDRDGAAQGGTEGESDREGLLNEALAGLAMRDLSLVDTLLETVEELETDAQDPDLLDKLFQIDNLATRMRRNGENFLVLTGHDGGESDAHDEIVPLLDVARAATSEIKDYPRVRLGKLPQTSITGMAADDISHLLAELLDNATANSPEHSQVVVSARELDDGRLMIVVEDEGVGIPEAQLTELNRRLAGAPVLDDEVPRHMGLYVASRIARRHGLEARLESRSFRGVNAYAIIPKDLLRVATPPIPGQARTSTVPATSASRPPVVPPPVTGANGVNGSASAQPLGGGDSAVTSAGLPRRSATPHGSPLRMMPPPDHSSEPPADAPPKLTGDARAEQIRDELGDFLDGEREALEDRPDGEDT